MKIYKLIHIHDTDDCIDADIKNLGFFSNLEKVEDAIDFFKHLPGFSKYPNGFIITEHEVTFKRKTKAPCVYELSICVHDKRWEYEFYSPIGLYTTQKAVLFAKHSFNCLNNKPNAILNCKLVKELWIDRWCIDEKSLFWSEGFH